MVIDKEQVRKLIDVSLSSSELPDAVIELDCFSGEALRYVATRTSNKDPNVLFAAHCMTAILLIPSVPTTVSESNAGFSYQLQSRNWAARESQLQQMLEDAIIRSETANPTDVGTAYNDSRDVATFDVAHAENTGRHGWIL